MRRKPPPRYVGLCLVIPDGVPFEDRLTGETVIRERTEQRLCPVPRLTPALTLA